MPTPLAHTSAHVLEFESLRDLLRGYAPSPLGQVKLALLVASSDRDWIETQQGLTTEIREFRRVGGHFEFSGLLDMGQSVEKARIAGAALETGEIRDIVLVVDRAAEWREIALNPPGAMILVDERDLDRAQEIYNAFFGKDTTPLTGTTLDEDLEIASEETEE